ncbi:MAG: DUF4870 domain-containing protein [Ectobacillus sp.]
MNSSEKLLAAGSYFSLFFAPFLFPIIIYFVVSKPQVKYHAKQAFVSHILPVLWLIAFLVFLVFTRSLEAVSALVIFGFIGFGILNVIIAIWNIVKGVKVLANE